MDAVDKEQSSIGNMLKGIKICSDPGNSFYSLSLYTYYAVLIVRAGGKVNTHLNTTRLGNTKFAFN